METSVDTVRSALTGAADVDQVGSMRCYLRLLNQRFRNIH